MKLYEISNNYIDLFNQADQDESIRDALDDTLEVIESEFEEKAINVAKYILNLEIEAEAIKNAESGMKDRRVTLDKKISWLKHYTRTHMEKVNKTKLWCPEFEMKIKKNPPSLIIRDEELIPAQFKKIVKTVSIDKKSIKDILKDGVGVKGCHLEQSNRLEIK